MITQLPHFYDPDARIVRCTVATGGKLLGGWLLGLDVLGRQYVVRVDGEADVRRCIPRTVSIHSPRGEN